MKRTVRLLSALLALLMIAAVLSACGESTDPADTSNAAVNTDPSVVTTPEETEAPLMPLEAKDYADHEFLVIWPSVHNDGHFMHDEIFSASNDGEVINSAVFKRNAIVEEAYHIKIASKLVWCSNIAAEGTSTVKSGDEATCDAYCAPIKMLTAQILNGLVASFDDSQYYSTDMPWWDHSVMEDYSIAGKKYCGSGDIIYSDNFYPYTIFCNLEKYDDYNFDKSVYQLVSDNQWTLEKMMEICAAAPSSSDDVWNYEDTYGLLLCNSFARAMYYSADLSIATIDADGHAAFSVDLDKSQALLEKLVGYLHNNHYIYDTDDDLGHNMPGKTHAQTAVAMFSAGQSIFYAEELITAERLTAAGFDSKFAVLPMPKYSADQAEYKCCMNDAVLINIPSNADLDRSVHILSAMSRESIDTLTPAFYDVVLTYKYMNDPQSVLMLDIILNSVMAPDLGTILDWGTTMTNYKTLFRDGKTDWASKLKSSQKIAGSQITAYNKNVDDLKAAKQ